MPARKLLTVLIVLLLATPLMGLITSGTTGLSTTDDDAVTVFTADQIAAEYRSYRRGRMPTLTIINEGDAAGWFTVDGGGTWLRLPAGPSSRTMTLDFAGPVQIKREAGGANLSDVFVDVH